MPPTDKQGSRERSAGEDADALAEFAREFGRLAPHKQPQAGSSTRPALDARIAAAPPRPPAPPPASHPLACRDPAHVELIAALERQVADLREALHRRSRDADARDAQHKQRTAELAALREEVTALRAEVAALGAEREPRSPETGAVEPPAPEAAEAGALGEALSRFSTACLVQGRRRVVFVGGSPACRKQLKQGLDRRLDVRFVEGDLRRVPQLPGADVVVVWGATELDHTVSDHFPGALYIPQRGLTGMLRMAAERIEGA